MKTGETSHHTKKLLDQINHKTPNEQFEFFKFGSKEYNPDPISLIEVINNDEVCLSARLLAVERYIESPEFTEFANKDETLTGFISNIVASQVSPNEYINLHGLQASNINDPKYLELVKVNGLRDIVGEICAKDGIIPELLLFDSESQFHDEYQELYSDDYPVMALQLLQYVNRFSSKNGAHLSPELKVLTKCSKDLSNRLAEASATEDDIVNSVAFTCGSDIILKAFELGCIDQKKLDSYKHQLNDALIVGKQLSVLFPPEFRDMLYQSYLEQISSIVYGYIEFEKNGGRLDIEIMVGKKSKRLQVNESCSPYHIIDDLTRSISNLYSSVKYCENNPGNIIASVSEDSPFQVFRFLKNTVGSVSQYIRPKADYSFDENLEFGTPYGVEASIGYTINLSEQYTHLGRAGAKHIDAMSIRIDREGIDPYKRRDALSDDRDPTRKIGTLSLDIGSILGDDESVLGTKVGRWMSYCNQLKMVNDPEPANLNHSPHHFKPSDGEEFANTLQSVIDDRLRRKATLTSDLIERVLTGR